MPDPAGSSAVTTLSPDAFVALGGGGPQDGAPKGSDPTPGTMSADDFAGLKAPADKPMQMAPGQVTGWVPNIVAGVASGVSGAINVMHDPYANLVGYPVMLLGMLAHDKIGPWFGAKPFTPEDRQSLLEDFNKQAGNAVVTVGAHAVGLPAPEDVVPTPGTGQSEVRAAVAGATGVALLGGGGRTTVPQAATRAADATAAGVAPLAVGATKGAGYVVPAAIGATAGGAGAVVADVVPDEYKDVASTAAQFLAGGAAALGAGAVQATARAGGSFVRGVLPGKAKPVVNPATGEAFTAQPTRQFEVDPTTGEATPPAGDVVSASPYQMRAAGRLITKAGGGSPGEVTAGVPEVPQPGVGESTGTLGQQTGNLGLIAKERALENTPYGRTAFQGKRAVDNLTRVQALRDATPADVGSAAGEWMAAQLARERSLEATEVATAQQAAGTATEAAGATPGLPGVQEIGAGQREAIEALRVPAKEAAGRAYQALDPDGTLALDTTPVAAARQTIVDGLGKGGKLSGAEADVMDAARDMRGVNKLARRRCVRANAA